VRIISFMILSIQSRHMPFEDPVSGGEIFSKPPESSPYSHVLMKIPHFSVLIELLLKISFSGVRNGSFCSRISENLEIRAQPKAARHTGCQADEQTD